MKDFTVADMHRLIGHDYGTILEIGCNEADDTVDFVARMPHATFHCFEPDPRAIAKFKAKNLPANVHLYEVALSDKIGMADFHQSDGQPDGECWKDYGPHWDKSGSLLLNDLHTRHTPWMSFLPPIQVQTTTLDAWANEKLPADTTIDMAWVDVQGAEALVLKGGQSTIKRLRFFFGECDPRRLYHGMAKIQDLDDLLVGFKRKLIEYRGFNFLWENTQL